MNKAFPFLFGALTIAMTVGHPLEVRLAVIAAGVLAIFIFQKGG